MRKAVSFVLFIFLGGMFLFIPATDAFATTEKMVNINTASVEELATLKGIGDKIAQRIIDYRKTNGPFKKIEDIMNVKGIREKTYNGFKNQITVGSVTGSSGEKVEDKKATEQKSTE